MHQEDVLVSSSERSMHSDKNTAQGLSPKDWVSGYVCTTNCGTLNMSYLSELWVTPLQNGDDGLGLGLGFEHAPKG